MAPWKCPDCGTWWSGLEHRCPQPQPSTSTNAPEPPWWDNWRRQWPYPNDTATATCNCTCTFDSVSGRWLRTVGIMCPIHDVQVTYTGWGTA